MTGQSIHVNIKAFLSRFSSDEDWLEGTALLDSRVLDSLMALQLITYLESEFAIVVTDDDLDPENFNSIRRMAALVARKRADLDIA